MRQIPDDSLLQRLIGHRIEWVTFWQYGYNLNTSLEHSVLQIFGRSFVRDAEGNEEAITTDGIGDLPFWVDPIHFVPLIEQEIVAARPADDKWGCEIEFKNRATLVIRTDSPYDNLNLFSTYY